MGNPFQLFDPGSLLSFIGEVAADLDTKLYQIDVSVGNAAWGGVSSVWAALESVWGWLAGIVHALWNWIQNAVHWLIHTALPAVEAFLNKIMAKVKAFLQPLINYIKLEMAWVQQVYNTLVKPLMVFLQRIRAVLLIFRLMHLKFAIALDQYIADLENRINSAFLSLESDLGRTAQWLNWIVDPTGVFQPVPYVLAAITSLSQLYTLLKNLPSVAIGAGEAQKQAASASSGTLSAVRADMQSRAGGLTATDLADHTAIVAGYQQDGYSWVH